MSRETKELSLAVRVSSSLLSQLDEYAGILEGQNPGIHVSRSDAVRYLLSVALQIREAQAGEGLLAAATPKPAAAAAAPLAPVAPVAVPAREGTDDGKVIRLAETIVPPTRAGGLAS